MSYRCEKCKTPKDGRSEHLISYEMTYSNDGKSVGWDITKDLAVCPKCYTSLASSYKEAFKAVKIKVFAEKKRLAALYPKYFSREKSYGKKSS